VSDEYALDLYPRDDPRDGTRLIRYTYEDLIAAEFRDVIGVGAGQATIWHDHPGAEEIDSRGEQYVRIVRLGSPSEAVVGGFWTSKMPFETAVASERRHLTISGPGQMAYLARAVMAPHTYIHDVFTGQDPFDDRWRLSNQSTVYANGPYLGAMLWRVIYEAQHFRNTATYTHKHADGIIYTDSHPDDRLVSRIPDLVLGFDQFEDSNGNDWTLTAGEFGAQVGENVLGVVQRLMQAGLSIRMDPDDFTLYAWEGRPATKLGRSTDRTGVAWGSGVVRFQAPTDGTIHTGNVLSDAHRIVNSYLPRGPIWVGGNDIYHKETGAGDAMYEGFVHSTAEDDDALAAIGDAQSTAREEAADVGTLRHRGGNVPANGVYRPGEHYQLDELVTINTGSGEFDYDEATYPVGAWRVSLEAGSAEWQVFAELGASYEEAQRREFAIPSSPGHTHPSNLCQPGQPGTSFTSRRYFSASPSSLGSLTPDAAWAVADSTVKELTSAPDGSYTGAQEDIFTGTNQALGNRKDEPASFAFQITDAAELAAIQAGGAEFRALIRARSRTGVGIDDAAQFHYPQTVVRIRRTSGGGSWVGTALAAHSGTPGLRFPQQTSPMVSRVWSGTMSAVAGAALNDWVVCELGTRHITPTTGGTGAYWGLTSIVGASDLPEEEGTATNLNSWVQIALTGVGATSGDLPLDVVHQDEESVGTSNRASRCDHQHAHGYLSADGTHYHDADQIDGLTDPLIEGFVLTTDGGQHVVQDHGDFGSTETIELVGGNVHTGTLSEDCTFAFTGATSGVECRFRLHMQQDDTGGWVPTFPGSVVWPDDTEPTWSTDPGAVDIAEFTTVDGGTTWYGDSGGSGGSVGALALDDLTDVTITAPAEDDTLRYVGGEWINDNRRWEALTDGEDVFVWDGDDLVHEWKAY
jgi:hypothetical protein